MPRGTTEERVETKGDWRRRDGFFPTAFQLMGMILRSKILTLIQSNPPGRVGGWGPPLPRSRIFSGVVGKWRVPQGVFLRASLCEARSDKVLRPHRLNGQLSGELASRLDDYLSS